MGLRTVLCALLPLAALVAAKTVDITVSSKTTVAIPETLYGYMWEVCSLFLLLYAYMLM
jgi:hypothetical protein